VITIHISNRQRRVKLDRPLLRRAVRQALAQADIRHAEISLAIVDDATIAAVHGKFLDDPTPTDVISFVLDQDDERLEGEIVASADTAALAAPRYGWTAADELLLYVVHGALHLAGYDDTTPAARRQMRRGERDVLNSLGSAMPKPRRRSKQ
jgi:probable rRNA maturation factor